MCLHVLPLFWIKFHVKNGIETRKIPYFGVAKTDFGNIFWPNYIFCTFYLHKNPVPTFQLHYPNYCNCK